jgi:CRP-like cAMP-binding protein
MSLFDAEPRSATVSTLETCECLILTQMQLYDAIDETPGIAINIIRLLSRRIRELNQKLNPPTPTVAGNKVVELRPSAG